MMASIAHAHHQLARSIIGTLLLLSATTVAIGNDGSLDTTFAGRGFQYVSPIPAYHSAVWGLGVVVTNEGRYLLHGRQSDAEFEGPTWYSLIQFHRDGSLDTAFGNNGRALWREAEGQTGIGTATDGCILVGTTQDIRVLSSSGSLLTTILPDAASPSPSYIRAMALWNNRIVVLAGAA